MGKLFACFQTLPQPTVKDPKVKKVIEADAIGHQEYVICNTASISVYMKTSFLRWEHLYIYERKVIPNDRASNWLSIWGLQLGCMSRVVTTKEAK